MSTLWAEDLRLAIELAQLAADTALPLFRRGVRSERKADGSIVTEGDFEVEKQLLRVLANRRPTDAILSEESGEHGASTRRWILDPIDGTSWFARRRPTWGTHIALQSEGEVVVGVITRPVQGRCYWAARGMGAHESAIGTVTPDAPLRVSTPKANALPRVMAWTRRGMAPPPMLQATCELVPETLDGALDVARGYIDAMYDEVSAPWDRAPAIPIVEEAGGIFRDSAGGRDLETRQTWLGNAALPELLRELDPAKSNGQ